MSREAALTIYAYLMGKFDANGNDLLTFVNVATTQQHGEWRFQGTLGFSGKFYFTPGRWYVDCYPEDDTPERRRAIDEANTQLRAIAMQLAILAQVQS
jgi:hypothetical protein